MQNECPSCGKPIPEGVDSSVCPSCLLMGFSRVSVGSSLGSRTWVLPPLEEVRAMFLPRFRVERFIGRGGMGAVYEAIQLDVANRKVAIKLLPKEVSSPERVARFGKEIEALARLNHPNIVVIYDSGKTDEGYFYFVMEYIDGVDLGRWLREKGPIDLVRAIKIISKICSALEFAHNERGIVHLDIKPANVFISDEGKTAKLGDFGLSSIVQPEDTRAQVEENGEDQGGGFSLHYSPPEQRAGLPADRRADIFAVGATFYTLLTGKIPPSEGFPEMFEANSALKPVSAIVAKAMQSDPSRRYQSVSDLRVQIEKVDPSVRGPIIRRRLAVGGSIIGMICASLAFGVVKWNSVGLVIKSAENSIHSGKRTEALRVLGRLYADDRWGFSLRRNELVPLVTEATKAIVAPLASNGDHDNWVTMGAFVDDGRVITGSWDRTVRLWDVKAGSSRELFKAEAQISCLDIDRTDGRLVIYVADWSGNCYVIGLSNVPAVTFRHSNGRCNWIAHSRDGKRIVTCGDDLNIRVWDAGSRSNLMTLPARPDDKHKNFVKSVAFDPDGKFIVSSGFDGTVRIWDATTGLLLHTIDHKVPGVNSAVFSPSGTNVLSGGSNGSLWLWDVADGTPKLRREIAAHNGKRVNAVGFDATGSRLLSCGDDGTAKIWDATTGELLLCFEANKDIVVYASFSPDGKRVVTTSKDKSAFIFDSNLPAMTMVEALQYGIRGVGP